MLTIYIYIKYLILTFWLVILLDPLYSLHKDKSKKELQEPQSTRIKFQHILKIVKNIFDFFHQRSYLSKDNGGPFVYKQNGFFKKKLIFKENETNLIHLLQILQ